MAAPSESRERVSALIEDSQIHAAGAPVDVVPLHRWFVPVVRHFADRRVRGGLVWPVDGDISERNPARVLLSDRLSDSNRRLYYAHEIGHAFCCHQGTYTVLSLDNALNDRQERQAWEIAAELLIPTEMVFESIFDGRSSEEIAAICEVPPRLVELYRRQYAG